MKIKGLRRKISFVVLIPLFIGILLTLAGFFLPFYLYYPKILNDYTNKMIENQRETILKLSSLISNSTSVGYMQSIYNGVNIISDVMEQYLFYGLDVQPLLNHSLIFQSLSDFNNERLLFNATNAPLYNISTYYVPKNLNDTKVQSNLNSSAIFNLVIKSASLLSLIVGSSFQTGYITYQNDGLFYRYPSIYNDYTIKGCASNQTQNLTGPVYSQNCLGLNNCTKCSYCPKPNTKFNEYYEPRCRMFYSFTNSQKSNDVVITPPHIFENSVNTGQTIYRGQNACRGQWNFTSTQLVLVYCIDYLLEDLPMGNLMNISNNKETYSYILDTNGNVLNYKNNNSAVVLNDNICTLEFGSNTNEEAKEYNNTIFPLFVNQRSEIKEFTKDNDKMMIAVTPIMMILSSNSMPQHIGSTGVVMKKSIFEKKFNELIDQCNYSLLISIYVTIGFLVVIAVLSAVWTHSISGSIIYPIDHLLKILIRMLNGDLEIDILESYQPSPAEVACLYQVFDELRVVKRFKQEKYLELTEATLVISQALSLFKKFGNKKGMEVCYMKLGHIFFKQELFTESAEYLSKALELSEGSNYTDILTIAKLKLEVFSVKMKGQNNKSEALKIFDQALEIIERFNKDKEFLPYLLDMAESLYEMNSASTGQIIILEEYLSTFASSDKKIIMQRFLYIKGLLYKNLGQNQKACLIFFSVLEDFPHYLPSIRERTIKALNEIFYTYLSKVPNFNVYTSKPCVKKDIILIVSSNLAVGQLSWTIHEFTKLILKPNDRMSLVQFHSECKVVFNLTKLPDKNIQLVNCENNSNEAHLYDSLLTGMKQFSLNNACSSFEGKREEWMLIITDVEDKGSCVEFEEVRKRIKDSKVNLAIASMVPGHSRLEKLIESARNGNIFYIKSEELAGLIFKEIEAYMCPEKEVFLPS